MTLLWRQCRGRTVYCEG